MMLNDASRGCPYDGVPARNVTDHAPDGRALQAAFCGSDAWKQCKRRGEYKSDNTFAHFSDSYETRCTQNPSGPQKLHDGVLYRLMSTTPRSSANSRHE
jgi:hypothetical protein